jgi:thioredoxin 1
MDVQQLSTTQFDQEVTRGPGVVLVEFGTAWCAPCRAIAPVLAQLAGAYAGRARIYAVDVEDSPELGQRFDIRSMPTLLFFVDGQPVDQVVGAVARRVLTERLDRACTRTGSPSPGAAAPPHAPR